MQLRTIACLAMLAASSVDATARQDAAEVNAQAIVTDPPYLDFGSPLPELTITEWVQPPPGSGSLNDAILGKAAVIFVGGLASCDAPNGADNASHSWIPTLSAIAESLDREEVTFVWLTEGSRDAIAQTLARNPFKAWVGRDPQRSVRRTIPMHGDGAILVDAGGRVRAITDPSHVTLAVIHDLFDGKQLWLPSTYRAKVPWSEYGGLVTDPTREFTALRPVLSGQREAIWENRTGKWLYTGQPATELIADAWWNSDAGSLIWRRDRMRIQNDAGVPETCFTAVVSIPNGDGTAAQTRLRAMLREYFDVEPQLTTEVRPVLVLRQPTPLVSIGQGAGTRTLSDTTRWWLDNTTGTTLSRSHTTLREVADFLETFAFDGNIAVLDETADSATYDYRLDIPERATIAQVAQCVSQQLRLVLERTKRPQPVLIIRKRQRQQTAESPSAASEAEPSLK